MELSTGTKTGITSSFKIQPRSTTAKGAAKSMAAGTRQSCLRFDRIRGWNNLNHEAKSNQANESGRYVARMRGRNEESVSPWVVKPITVKMARLSKSPRTRNGRSLSNKHQDPKIIL